VTDRAGEDLGAGELDLHSGAPWWLVRDGLGLVVPPLTEHVECDVAIVGAGITGALAAEALSRRGLRVVVVDARHLGQGSTLASTCLLQYDTDVPLSRLTAMIGPEHARRAYRLGIEAIDALEHLAAGLGVPFERRPSMYFASDPAGAEELRREHDARRDAGLAVRWLDSGALERGWGLRCEGAIHSEVGAQMDPYRFCHAALAEVMRRGVRVHDRTAVVSMEESSAGVLVTTDRDATIRARWAINATGYEAAMELPPDSVTLRSTYAIVSEPTAPARGLWADRCMLWECADPYLYARWSGDRLLAGGEDEDFIDAPSRDELIGRKAAAIVRRLRDLLPSAPLEPAFAWTGTFATTPDGLGYIGRPPGRERTLFALGFGGNGITFAATAARLLCGLVLGEPSRDVDIFRFGRSRRAER
jgi:glycine/D-amino acid oxidase-like deaminating enzyme